MAAPLRRGRRSGERAAPLLPSAAAAPHHRLPASPLNKRRLPTVHTLSAPLCPQARASTTPPPPPPLTLQLGAWGVR
uniref:Uncharacterized protein n=1 Tax=Oryza brachyantha TaxID=4533 RepID=J3LXB0_ORYBR